MELIKKSILENKELHQLVILGAGLAPLSLECRARFDNLEIFDIDLDNMEIKSKLASEADERMCGIKFITSDMENLYELQSALVKNGFKPGKPALVIAEGISYYVAAEALRNVLSFFKRAKASRFILDYLVPTQDISPDRQHIPDRIFELIRSQCNLPDIRRYKSADFESYFNTTVLQRLTMEDIEKIRKDKNTHFPSEASGWIEIGLLAV